MNAFLKRGIRTSFRLTPNAHRKKRLVISTKGARKRRSVTGTSVCDVEVAILLLSECAIEVDVSTVHEQPLPRGVAGLRAQEKYRRPRDLVVERHALAEGNLRRDALELVFGIR